MALADLIHILESLRAAVPDGGVNLSYYTVLAGFIILVGFTGFAIVAVIVRSFLLVFKKPPSYAIKLALITGLILFLLGLVMP